MTALDDEIQTADPSPGSWLNRTVVGAGLTSGLGDLCYETTTVLLPGFLAVLGVPAAALGLIEGTADALASFTKMFAGYAADKLGFRKLLVVLGYALTPVGQILIALAGGWPLILAGRLVSWFGKGLRGPLRDAIVIQAVTASTRGRAFGFHRAVDSIGAVAGPLLGVTLLGWSQAHGFSAAMPFRMVLMLSAIPGTFAALSFLILVRDPERSANPALKFGRALASLPIRFKRYLGAVALFGLGDFSHSLLILGATQLLTPQYGVVRAAQIGGLLYVGRNLVELVGSYPIGRIADHVGSVRVLAIGYVIGVVTAAAMAVAFLVPEYALPILILVFALAGFYTAAEEALEPMTTADMVSSAALATSYGALGVTNGMMKFASSALVGFLWSAVSPTLAFCVAASFMAVGAVALGSIARQRPI